MGDSAGRSNGSIRLVPTPDQMPELCKRLVIAEVATLIMSRHDNRLMLGGRPVSRLDEFAGAGYFVLYRSIFVLA